MEQYSSTGAEDRQGADRSGSLVLLIVNPIIAFVKRLGYNRLEMATQKRNYVLRKRAKTAEETRRRIIEAACELLSQAGYPDVSLDRIAERAGVSRQTVYVQFGSKRGVLHAVAEYIETASYGTGMVEGVMTISDPVRTMRNGIGDQMAFFQRNADLLRTFYAQNINDPDFGAVWQERLQERWKAIRILMEKLKLQGRLSETWSVEDATDWVWSLTNFQRYDELVLQQGCPPEKLAHRLLESIDTVLLTKESASESKKDSLQGESP